VASENDSTIVIGIELDDGSIKKALVNADDLAAKMGKSLSGGVSSGIDKSLTGLAIQFELVAKVASKALSVVGDVFSKAVDEAIGAEQAITSFNFALANSGKFTEAASADFLKFAADLQKVGTVSDDAVVKAASSLVAIGGLSGDALKQASKAGVDLAAGLGTDVGSAFDLVAKAASGNTAALGRYGIKVDESIPKSERFAAVLAQINDKFGGLDVGKANTFGGALAQLQLALGDVFENIGNIIIKSPVLVTVMKFAGDLLSKLSEKIAAFGGQGDVFRPIIGFLLAMADSITKNVLPVFELLYNFGKFLFNSLLTGFATLASGFNGTALLIGEGLSALGLISDESLAGLQSSFDLSKQAMIGLSEQTTESFSQIATDFSVTAAVDGVLTDLTRLVDETPLVLDKLKLPIKASTDNLVSTFALTAKALADIVNKSIVAGISQGVQLLVSNITRGKDAFAGLLKTIGSIFGDMLITIGTTVLLAGVGMQAIQASIVGLTGGPALFAGVALIAAGALLKALSGGGGAETPTTTVPSGTGGVPTVPDIPGQGQPDQDRNRETAVNINISGNVLDRKETGLEIATVLQEYFDTSSGVLSKA
jgi:hypothetical protein